MAVRWWPRHRDGSIGRLAPGLFYESRGAVVSPHMTEDEFVKHGSEVMKRAADVGLLKIVGECSEHPGEQLLEVETDGLIAAAFIIDNFFASNAGDGKMLSILDAAVARSVSEILMAAAMDMLETELPTGG